MKGGNAISAVALAILLGAAMLALSIYLRPAPAPYRYEMHVGVGVARLDRVTGEMVVCSRGECSRIDQGGGWTLIEPKATATPEITLDDLLANSAE